MLIYTGSEIATSWSPMRPKIRLWRLNFLLWSPMGDLLPQKRVSACFSHSFWSGFHMIIKESKSRTIRKPISAMIEAGKRNTLSLLESISQWNLKFRELDQSDRRTGVTRGVLAESIARLLFSALNYWDQVEQKPMLCVSQKTGQTSRTRKPRWSYQCSPNVHRPWIRVREIVFFKRSCYSFP